MVNINNNNNNDQDVITTEESICSALCEGVDVGYAGICCSEKLSIKSKIELRETVIGEEYCDCGSGSNTPVSCPEGEQFCDAIGDESPEKKTKICLHL